MDDGPMDYASSGVDIDSESKAISSLIGALSASSRESGVIGAPVPLPGGFGGIIEFGDSRLALATDGVGSKLQIANHLGRLEGVGIDCVAMNVNDLICVGAEPIAFVDYIAVPETIPSVHAALGSSLSEACSIARVTLAGGETATLPGIVKELDMSGTALGWFPEGGEITGSRLASGDVIIGLPSSGIHSNGYTLVRAVLDRSGLTLDSPAPFDVIHPGREVRRFPEENGEVSIGEVLLNPTRIYVDPIIDLINLCRSGEGPCDIEDIKAIAHITGGGLSNLLRLHESLGWHISNPLPVSPEFEWISEVGDVEIKEMHRTFNMGMGMAVAVSEPVGSIVSSWISKRLPGTRIVGEIRDEGHKVTHVDSRISFDHY
ncbi:MAG: phosphoribosylformylglycinamidine cyclo-ligase [Methanobacteriota archaeon]|nr:MAG: phosphoribosylformylglycinamidine cyclo-ligase [Euryarchaeota archaeon]|tara:strand:- start:208 stop:1332 length:1125 start_codon:yes stop_codon:yes gene_type:complete